MQLTVREASKFLDVSEGTVTRWIKQRGLPAQRINGQYRFNRAELLEWATANQIKVSVKLFDHLRAEDEPPPSLVNALETGGIFYRLSGATKESVLRSLVQALPITASIDRELLLRLFLAREASASTGIGDGVALPHVRNPIVLNVAQPMVTLCFLEKPVDFAALDGKPVHVLFSLICPTIRGHLQLLARLSHALHDVKFKAAVMRQAAGEELMREARRIEAALSSSHGVVKASVVARSGDRAITEAETARQEPSPPSGAAASHLKPSGAKGESLSQSGKVAS